MSYIGAIQALQAHAISLAGMKDAPTYAPEGMNVFPFSVAYPGTGNVSAFAGGVTKGLHIIVVEFHYARIILPNAIEMAIPHITGFVNLLVRDPTLGGAVSTILLDGNQQITYEFGRMIWASIQTVGTRFKITVKLEEAP